MVSRDSECYCSGVNRAASAAENVVVDKKNRQLKMYGDSQLTWKANARAIVGVVMFRSRKTYDEATARCIAPPP